MYQRAPCTLIYTLNVLMKCDIVYLVSVDCSIREYFMIYYLLCDTYKIDCSIREYFMIYYLLSDT